MNLKRLSIILLFQLLSINIDAKHIIWDLGGVLLKPDKFRFAWNIGFSNFFMCAIQGYDVTNVKEQVFEFLYLFDKEDKNKQILYEANGEKLPDVFVDWMTGYLTGKQLVKILHNAAEDLYKTKYFGYSEKELIKSSVAAMFDHDYFSISMKPIKAGWNIVKECSKKNSLYILSNWDKLSFDEIYNTNFKLFKYFEPNKIYVSGAHGLVKPDNKFYQKLLNDHKLDPKECIFIDDQKENVDSAKNLGMNGIWLKDGNYQELRKELIKLGAL